MSSGITLKQGKPPKAFWENLANHYRSMGAPEGYAERRSRQWKEDPDIITYGAKKDSEEFGWIIYHPHRSTIEEILVEENWAGKGMEAAMVDALISRESLVSSEILKEDTEKYTWMVAYGFRPTRFFASQGFEFVKMDLSTTVFLRKVTGQRPSREYPEKERVVLERVPPTRSHREIKASLTHVLDALGGLEKFLKKGQTVVIKPNVVADHGLRNGVYSGGIVTDLGLLKALIEILLPIAKKVIVAEGASINRAETMKLFAHYGYDSLRDIDPAKVDLVDLNTDRLVEKVVPGGKRMLSRKIPQTLEDADVIINLPVMKTHFAAVASLAIKNLQGAIPPLEKYMTHYFGLWQNLINIHHLVKPKLVIIDGLTAQEDFGPVYGSPKTMNLLIGGTNAVAVDAVTMRIMGLDPVLSPPVKLAYMQGLGPVEPEMITTVGASIKEVRSPFKQPVINMKGGHQFVVHDDNACPGCRGYLHYVLHKLRRPDPKNPGSLLIDRPFRQKVNVFLGPVTETVPNPEERNIFLGICQQHNAGAGQHLAGCPPHAEVIMKGIFSLYPDVERPQYADENAEDALEEMLKELLEEESTSFP
ncbi:MAG: DUF362 domain-containing protein [Deltaproteobacteria bacterium]|nr:DUF362 domain-containing protein [Deltaproteobacteria bacterium]